MLQMYMKVDWSGGNHFWVMVVILDEKVFIFIVYAALDVHLRLFYVVIVIVCLFYIILVEFG